jgi:hypothetical protein
MVDSRLLAPIQGFKGDPIGFLLRSSDNGQRVPVTKTKTAYSLTLHLTVGQKRGVIGAVHEIATRQRQEVDEEWEVNSLATGIPRELIPQIVSGRSITLKRYDLYSSTLEQLLGIEVDGVGAVTLANQTGPMSMRFMWKNPSSGDADLVLLNTPTTQVYEYCDCYITDIGRTVSMNGNIIVGADATIVWRDIRRIQ